MDNREEKWRSILRGRTVGGGWHVSGHEVSKRRPTVSTTTPTSSSATSGPCPVGASSDTTGSVGDIYPNPLPLPCPPRTLFHLFPHSPVFVRPLSERGLGPRTVTGRRLVDPLEPLSGGEGPRVKKWTFYTNCKNPTILPSRLGSLTVNS